jgi:hypothetical protein
MNTTALTPFNGSNYQHDRDAVRLTDQLKRVHSVMSDRDWHTLERIAQITGDPTPSVSAQIRHLRKARFGGWEIEKRYHGQGLYAYRLTGEKVQPNSEPQGDPTLLPPAAPELLEAAQLENVRLKALLDEASSYLDCRLLSAFSNESLPDRIAAALHRKIPAETS